jgi:tRNA U34 5-methylaminomethyl-2-thiouridine-forming methyltransferase MnmC
MLPNPEALVTETLSLVPTRDGTVTFFSHTFQEAFHSLSGAYQEAIGKFVEPTQLVNQARRLTTQTPAGQLKLLDVCYGLGYNSAAALTCIWETYPNCPIHLMALELDPQVPRAAIKVGGLSHWPQPVQAIISALAETQQYQDDHLQASLHIGDARQTLHQLIEMGFQADAIFLDPFSPPHCPQLWTVEFIAMLSQCLAPTGRLATYSCAAAVRNALQFAGLKIGSSTPVGRRAPGTIASFTATDLPPLSLAELEHLQTQAGIPYRDPTLTNTAAQILECRQQEQQFSERESTSSWKKRWGFQSQQ